MSCAPRKTAADASSSDAALMVATLAAMATLVPVVAYQLRVLDTLPDPPGRVFASGRITASKAAHPFGIPDGILGLSSYGTTLALALLARRQPAARKLLAVKLVADGSMASFNMVRQAVSFGKLCSWCTGTAICTVAMVFAGRRVIAEQARAAKSTLLDSLQ